MDNDQNRNSKDSAFNKRKSLGKRVSFAHNASVKYISNPSKQSSSRENIRKKQKQDNSEWTWNNDISISNPNSDYQENNTDTGNNLFQIPELSSAAPKNFENFELGLDLDGTSISHENLNEDESFLAESSGLTFDQDESFEEQISIARDESLDSSFNSSIYSESIHHDETSTLENESEGTTKLDQSKDISLISTPHDSNENEDSDGFSSEISDSENMDMTGVIIDENFNSIPEPDSDPEMDDAMEFTDVFTESIIPELHQDISNNSIVQASPQNIASPEQVENTFKSSLLMEIMSSNLPADDSENTDENTTNPNKQNDEDVDPNSQIENIIKEEAEFHIENTTQNNKADFINTIDQNNILQTNFDEFINDFNPENDSDVSDMAITMVIDQHEQSQSFSSISVSDTINDAPKDTVLESAEEISKDELQSLGYEDSFNIASEIVEQMLIPVEPIKEASEPISLTWEQFSELTFLNQDDNINFDISEASKNIDNTLQKYTQIPEFISKSQRFAEIVSSDFFSKEIAEPIIPFYEKHIQSMSDSIQTSHEIWENSKDLFSKNNPSFLSKYNIEDDEQKELLKHDVLNTFESVKNNLKNKIFKEELARSTELTGNFDNITNNLEKDTQNLNNIKFKLIQNINSRKLMISNLKNQLEASKNIKIAKINEIEGKINQTASEIIQLNEKSQELAASKHSLIQKKNMLTRMLESSRETQLKYQEEIIRHQEMNSNIKVTSEKEVFDIHNHVSLLCKLNCVKIVHATSKRLTVIYNDIAQISLTLDPNDNITESLPDSNNMVNIVGLYQISVDFIDTFVEKTLYNISSCFEKSNLGITNLMNYIKETAIENSKQYEIGETFRRCIYLLHSFSALISDMVSVSSVANSRIEFDSENHLPLILYFEVINQSTKAKIEAKLSSKFPPTVSFNSSNVSWEKMNNLPPNIKNAIVTQGSMSCCAFETNNSIEYEKNEKRYYGSLKHCGNTCVFSPLITTVQYSSNSDVDDDVEDVLYNPNSMLELKREYGSVPDNFFARFSQSILQILGTQTLGKGNVPLTPGGNKVQTPKRLAKGGNRQNPNVLSSSKKAKGGSSNITVYTVPETPPLLSLVKTIQSCMNAN
ncbi:hypothetical protein BB558_002497 [Smittium angustum]|uniref:Uncharacterized protein n=1 Tax=Smittium angustum TaxID=133377 RepID=A0A2U1J8X2_SMIAN|nr:hypothetical protein BB558_002497 [Smittium angustum]